MNPDYQRQYQRGFLAGQIVTYCEQVNAGAKGAAQVGLAKADLEFAIELIGEGGCKWIVDDERSADRAAVWIYKYEHIGELIQRLSQKNAPSGEDIFLVGKLFGYSDVEIVRYLTEQRGDSVTSACG